MQDPNMQHKFPRSYLQEDLKKFEDPLDDQEGESWPDPQAQSRERREQNQLYQDEFYLYEVEFKRSKGFCEKTAFCAEDFEIGDYIRVESDSRTHELGVVCNICVMSSETTPFFGENGRENFRKIIGRATPSEKALFLTKIRDEERALHICNELVARKRLPIVVVEAKFQLDRTKLTFLYMSDRRVDFRDLIRNLFSLYKTRIWMQKLDVDGNQIHSSFSSNDPTAAALTPQRIQQSRRDSQRNREMAQDYFEPNSLEDNYSDYSALSTPRNPSRPPAPDYSRAGFPLRRNPETTFVPTGFHVYRGEQDGSQQFGSDYYDYDLESTIRSTQPWAEYPPPGHPPPPLRSQRMTASYPIASSTAAPYPVPHQGGPYPYCEYYDRENEFTSYDDSIYSASSIPPRGPSGYRSGSASYSQGSSFKTHPKGQSPSQQTSLSPSVEQHFDPPPAYTFPLQPHLYRS